MGSESIKSITPEQSHVAEAIKRYKVENKKLKSALQKQSRRIGKKKGDAEVKVVDPTG